MADEEQQVKVTNPPNTILSSVLANEKKKAREAVQAKTGGMLDDLRKATLVVRGIKEKIITEHVAVGEDATTVAAILDRIQSED